MIDFIDKTIFMKIDLQDKIALVTGGADGIGKGCVQQFCACGATVVIFDINHDAAFQLSQSLNGIGYRTLPFQGDVSSSADIERVAVLVKEQYGKLDILVNNAGFNFFKGIADTTEQEWDRLMNVDLKAVFLITQALLPMLKASGGGSVVNISSIHTRSTVGSIYAYAAAKGGVSTMCKTLCQELGPFGIRVNTVSPGFTRTPLLDRWFQSTPDPDETEKMVLGYHPLGKIATPEDIGNAVVFLSSHLASNITGIDLVVDGGLSIRLMH